MTFGLSILFHAGLIYSIPAVDLFSESPLGVSTEPIVVDLIQDESSESVSDIPVIEENQSQASVAEMPVKNEPAPLDSALDQISPEPDPTQDIEMALPIVEARANSAEEAILLAQSSFREPKIESLRKTAHVKNTPFQRQRPIETEDDSKLSAAPFFHQTDRVAEPSERNPLSPLDSYQQEPQRVENIVPSEKELQLGKRRIVNLENPHSEKELQFGKRRVVKLENPPSTLNPNSRVESLTGKRQRFGMSKSDELVKNQFGIFVGETYKEMRIKENMQKTIFEQEKKETALLPEETPKAAQNLATGMTIEGPARGRRIMRLPAPPKVEITIGVELKLKFWVLPDGTIGEVVPLKRGDTHLEQIAIAYLKRWQFEPLASGSPQQKIWGTIPIRFIVQ